MEIKKIVTHAGTFHADEVLATAFLLGIFPAATVERTFTPSETDFSDPSVAVLDVGRQFDPSLNNFDHHQDASLPATNLLVLKHFEEDSRVAELLCKYLFEYVSDVDLGKIVEKSDHHIPTFNSIIRSLNGLNDGWDLALHIADVTIKGLRKRATDRIHSEYVWKNLEKRNQFAIHDSTDFIVGWQEIAENEGIQYLLMQSPRGGYQVYSRDSERFPIPQHDSQTFLHNSRFTATYKSKEDAITHLETF